ncbi:MAG: hypothetical protein HC767_07925 [Akkermansiaceae bacterium]|nr:hypothetical protein [Akkermansiaceae bacterium]
MPLPYYLSWIAIFAFGLHAFMAREKAWGIPACAVLATTIGWYLFDAIYNDYALYIVTIGQKSLKDSWWQVFLFICTYGFIAPLIHRSINRKLLGKSSFVIGCYKNRYLDSPQIQHSLDQTSKALLFAWLSLMAVAIYQVGGNVGPLFAPYLSGVKIDPWSRSRLGAGFDALLAFAGYIQLILTAGFGVLFAVSKNPRTRTIAGIVCLLSFPYYLFDRTRNTMLSTMVPGVLAWIFFRFRGSLILKIFILAGAFFVANSWMTTVMASRNESRSIFSASTEKGKQEGTEPIKHEGLNMFEELGWINLYIGSGHYKPNSGARYFAELVNPIPRALWKNKPLIGIDYAIARGQGDTGDDGLVTATISTGMIGQGVVNFGGFFGPVAAATLMALWTALLARQDLMARHELGRLLLYVSGLILTFNIGRDITLLVLYPFFFGLGMLWAWKTLHGGGSKEGELIRRAARELRK